MPPPAANLSVARLTVPVPAGSRSRSATWRHAVHRSAFTTFKKTNIHDSVNIDNMIHIDITYEIISRSNAH
jgi:hypothetical protein